MSRVILFWWLFSEILFSENNLTEQLVENLNYSRAFLITFLSDQDSYKCFNRSRTAISLIF